MMKQLENEALSMTGETMQTYTYVSQGNFQLMEKPKPVLMHPRDAIVKVTLASICSSDLHIKHGSVRRELPWGMRWWASWSRWARQLPM